MNIEARLAALEARVFGPPVKPSDTVVIGNLMWHRATNPDRLNFKDAESYCKALTTGSHTDWRLPTIQELLSLVDYTRFDPAIDIAQFPDTTSTYYWSSSPFASAPADYAWVVGFSDGGADFLHRDGAAFVRAVRSVAPASQVTP